MPKPDWHPSPCPLPARRGEGGRRPGEGRFMGKGNLQNSDVNRSHEPVGIPSTALRAPSPPLGEKDGMRGEYGPPFAFCARIMTMNDASPIPRLARSTVPQSQAGAGARLTGARGNE